jgi:hypothetical protein
MFEQFPARRAVGQLSFVACATLAGLGLVSFQPAAAAEPAAEPARAECSAFGDVHYVCGLVNPEDLVRVGSSRWLVASGMGKGGSIHLIDTKARTATALHISVGASAPAADPAAGFGVAFGPCPGPLDTAAGMFHGLAIRNGRAAGHYTLLAVNHGGRETIEVFDLAAPADKTPTARWLGCVVMPTGLAANSVAAFDDGTLLATVLMLPGRTMGDSLAGRNTGVVLQWQPGAAGFAPLAGTELPSNNGIEAAATGDEFYVVSTGQRRIYAFNRKDTSKPLRYVEFKGFAPDNVHASTDGPLLTAGMNDEEPGCNGPPKADDKGAVNMMACARGFMAASFDPKSMKILHTVRSPAHLPFMGAASAMQVGREVWIGGFHSDRIATRPWP